MLTTEQEDYLLSIFPKLNRIRYWSGCCSKKRKIIYKQILIEIFDKLNIPEEIKDDPDESILVLDKCLFELCTSSIEKRKKVLGALKNTNRRKC